MTTEAVCWGWLNAMSGTTTRKIAAVGFDRMRSDPRIEVVPHSEALTTKAVRLFAARADKEWSLTDCLSFVVMRQEGIRDALTADNHFDQAGFRAILTEAPPNAQG